MAGSVLKVYNLLNKSFQSLSVTNHGSIIHKDLLSSTKNTINIIRNTSFFCKLPAEMIWKSVTSVSNAGKKRGRGRASGRLLARNLNRGQVIGIGKANIQWPGLSAPIIRGKEIVQQQQLPEDPEREARILKLRDQMGSIKRFKLSPIDRGFSGSKLPGRWIGPPDPVGEDHFEGFDTKVLEMKQVMCMKGNFGRKRQVSVVSCTGNKNGLAGFALGKAVEAKAAVRKSKNRAAQKLMEIKIHNNHTVYHDFFTQFGKTKLYVYKKPEGFGLVCHRVVKAICEVAGIKDLYAKLEGSNNVQHIIKAFFLGLLKQKTHQEIADEKKLHLVEFKRENNYFPTVIASPKGEVRTRNEIPKDEILDFQMYSFDGRVKLQKKKHPRFFENTRGYQLYLIKNEITRNHYKIRLNLLAEYGELRSFLTDKYPECRPYRRPEKKKETDEEMEDA